MSKPRADSKLKTLPEDRQERIIEWTRTAKTDACPGGLQHAREQLELDGLKVSMRALSEFVSWWELRERFSSAESRAQQVVDLLKAKDPSMSPDKVRELGQALFTMEAINSQQADVFVSLERLALDQRTADAKGKLEREKIKIADRRVKLLEAAARSAKEKLTAVAAKGGLTPETLAEIEEAANLL